MKQTIKNRKAQLKIQEMMFMLLGVFLFFVLAGLFMLTIINSNIRQSATQIAEEQTILSVRSISSSPEFICTNSKPNCIDSDKIIGLMENKNYKNFWPYSSLMIVRESGFNKTEQGMIKCNTKNYPDCDAFIIFDNNKEERAVGSFVSLCRKESENSRIYDKCEIAKVIAGFEVKG